MRNVSHVVGTNIAQTYLQNYVLSRCTLM